MSLKLGEIVPNFSQNSTQGVIDLYNYMEDDWCILFSHPRDYTPVCTTELGEVAKLKSDFAKRHTKVLGLSVDSLEDHFGWAKDIEETQGQALNFPLLADADRKVSELYGMIHPKADDTFTVRSVFIIDSQKKLRLSLTYPASTGRNFTEILRVLDSLQLTDSHKVATPVNWKSGEDVIVVPTLSNDEATKIFPKGIKEIKPYLRTTPCP